MTHNTSPLSLAVADASLVAKWYAPHEQGWEAAWSFFAALRAGTLDLTAPDHLKAEVVRALQLGVRDKRYTVDDGVSRLRAFLTLEITYLANDLLFEDAFRLSSTFQMALYDSLYVALAQALEIPLVTADRRAFNLAQQRQIAGVVWFEDVAPAA